MIDEILKKVDAQIGDDVSTEAGIDRTKVPQALESISATVFEKANEYINSGQLMELKDVFLSGSDSDKEEFMNELKSKISVKLNSDIGVDTAQSDKITDLSIPVIIKESKEALLGPDGKLSFTDFPRLLSFFKSGGKEVKGSGGLGGLFGF